MGNETTKTESPVKHRAVSIARPRYFRHALLARMLVLASVLLSLTIDAQSNTSEEVEEASPLTLVATQVLPAAPTAEALCKLRVMLENTGERAVSALRFRVALDGLPLTVYDRQLFIETLPPGEVSRVELFNFWTSETDRPPPVNGTLEVEVTLESARYLLRDVADDGTEILTLQEAVPGLPASLILSVPIAQGG